MNESKAVTRRRFLKGLGLAALAGAAASCGVKMNENKTPDTKAEGGKMTTRINPNSGDEVSILGYGMMRLPTQKIVDGVNEKEVIDQEMVNKLVDYAMEHGVNYYDTSPVYCQGKSEEATGIALSRYPRDKYFIATKLSNFSPQTWPREESIKMFENSLKYLQTDYIDYLLLHSIGGGGMDNFRNRFIDNGIFDYLKQQKEEGRIKNLGFSYHGDVEVFDTMLKWQDEGKCHWDFVQIQLNYIDWNSNVDDDPRRHATDAKYLYTELEKRGIPAVIMEPLLGGRLANVPDPIKKKFKERRPDDSAASWAFRFAGTPKGILTVLSGMTYMEHLQDNIGTYSPLEACSEEERDFLRRCALEYLSNNLVPCTDCKYCMPCPYGLDIPAIFAHYNKCINDDNVPRDARDPNYEKARRAFLVGYDRKLPRQRQASRCIGCGECLKHCPQEIDIPKRLEKIDEYVTRLRAGMA
ncbi:MAG: aldo/keto reductase [Clostridium sp.]|nr:aldo/keto reductase [Clostridium sp.]